MLFSTLVFCFEYAYNDSEESDAAVAFRDTLMRRFFSNILPCGVQKLSRDDPYRPFCDRKVRWMGITCELELIRRVQYSGINYGNFDVRFLPNSVLNIEIASCEQHFAMDTRCLPQSLQTITLRYNRIYGSPDLSSLPDNLTHAHFDNNQMWGPIDLTMLPRKLQVLDISFNRIQQEIVLYNDLPTSIQKIVLEEYQDSNGIHRIAPLDRRAAVKRGTIFVGGW